MAGNEKAVASYLFSQIGKITLPHLGKLTSIGAPNNSTAKFAILTSASQLNLITTEGSSKKADLYINGHGVSIKQEGGSFPYNRLQRSEMLAVFRNIGMSKPEASLELIDQKVDAFHSGTLKGRSRLWSELFSKTDFKKLLKYLMTTGSPNHGDSSHPAEFILEAPVKIRSVSDIKVYTFDEYFEAHKDYLFLALRRQCIGQVSESEHHRAVGIASKKDNQKWVYKTISGKPRVHPSTGTVWRDNVPENERRTVYMIFIEKC